MKRMWATFIKEKIILTRDVIGLCILFIMPIILIIIMAHIQDAPFRDYQELKLDILLVDEDQGVLGKNIKEGLLYQGSFNIVDSIDERVLTLAEAEELVNKGSYKFSIHIPSGASIKIISNANQIMNFLSESMGMPSMLPVKKDEDTLNVNLHFDPAIKVSFKNSIGQSLQNFLTQTEGKILLERIQRQMNPGVADDTLTLLSFKSIGLKESRPRNAAQTDVSINSVQHNVPAWTIFAMFFIAIPIAGNMIQERANASRIRTLLIPNSQASILIGKLLFYVSICLVQFYIMVLVGRFIIPLTGLDSLQIGNHHGATFATAFSISVAAVGIGLLAGVIFKTPNQVLNLMVITIVIL